MADQSRTLPDGTKIWTRDGTLHRDDGPARVRPDGERAWYRNGSLHREDGPAKEYPDGTRAWYRRGDLQRVEARASSRESAREAPESPAVADGGAMSKPRPFRISFETPVGSEDLGELAAEDHVGALSEALRRHARDCPEEVCDIVATDGEGRERRVEIDPYGQDFPLAIHAPDRYLRKRAEEDRGLPPINERDTLAPPWER